MSHLLQFALAFVGTLAFAVLFNAPKKSILFCAFAGTLGWAAYQAFLDSLSPSITVATLAGSMVVAICGEIMARIFKKPVTIYILPGIIPLVPGNGIYMTMNYLLNKNIPAGTTELVSTLVNAAAIAVGLLLVSGVARALSGRDIRRGNG